MTVATGPRRLTSATDGVTTSFTNPIFVANGDLRVYLHPTSPFDASAPGTLLVEGAGYAITGTGLIASQTVASVAPAAGQFITRLRVSSRAQGAEYVVNDGFPAKTHERQLDRLSLVTQELDDDLSAFRTNIASIAAPIASAAAIAAATAASPILLALLLASLPDPSLPYSTWIVAPDGTDASAGTMADPWSAAWAMDEANADVEPGDLMLWRGGEYGVTDFSGSGRGLDFKKGGSDARPVRHAPLPGELPVIDARIPGITWTQIDPVKDIWESDQAFQAGNPYNTSGSVKINGLWYPLVPARGGDVPAGSQIGSATQSYLVNGEYYPGPMEERVTATGKFNIKLTPPSGAAMLAKPTAAVTDTDPNENDIALSLGGGGVTFFASNVIWEIPVINASTSFRFDITDGPRRNIWFRDGYDLPGYGSIARGGVSDGMVVNWLSDGRMVADWWGWYIDIKGGSTALEAVRKLAVNSGDAPGTAFSSSGWKHIRYTIRNFFDAVIGSGQDDEWGAVDPLDPYNQEKAWANACRFENIWDDSFQMFSVNQGLHVHHCYFLGAGISRDGSSSTVNWGIRWPRIEDCVFVPQAMIPYGRQGATDADTGGDLSGFRYPPALSSHGIRTGPADHTFPWWFRRNLVLLKMPSLGSGDLQLFLQNPGIHDGGLNVIVNNIFVTEGLSISPAGAPSVIWLGQRLYADLGREVIDGNLLVSANYFTGAGGAVKPVVRFVNVGGVDVADPNGGNGWRDFDQLRANATVLAATRIGYAPGIQADGGLISGALADVVNPVSFRPVAAEAQSGAADVAALLGTIEAYRAEIGAREVLPA